MIIKIYSSLVLMENSKYMWITFVVVAVGWQIIQHAVVSLIFRGQFHSHEEEALLDRLSLSA